MSLLVVSKNGSVSFISSTLGNEMRMTVRNPVIFALLDVVETPKVMPDLVTKAVISECTGLLRDRDGGTRVVTEGDGSSTAREFQSQQRCCVRSISQLLVGILHIHEVFEKVAAAVSVIDRGLLVTELGHRHGDLAVDVSLVGLGYHLVNEVLNVGSGGSKFRCVIKHYRISSLALNRSTLSSCLLSGR